MTRKIRQKLNLIFRKHIPLDLKILNTSVFRWALVGVFSTATDYVFFLFFYKNFHSVLVANLLSSIIATSANYLLHHRWTFDSNQHHSRTGPRYFGSLAFWWIVSTILIEWLIRWGINVEFAKLAPTIILLPLNYFVLSKIVFKS
jgi:putative flippase GtrA